MHKILIFAFIALALAGCTGEETTGEPILAPERNAHQYPQVQYVNETGTLTTLPILPGIAEGDFEMQDANAAIAHFVGDDLTLTLTDPEGGTHGQGQLPVIVGNWTWRVTGDVAVQSPWSMSIQISLGDVYDGYLQETVSVPPSQFFEINTQMPVNGTFCWDWNGSGDLAFDVHSHFDDEVQYLVEKTTDAHKGCFTNEREGGYSLLWENGDAVPASLAYTVWGEFEVDSYFPPR